MELIRTEAAVAILKHGMNSKRKWLWPTLGMALFRKELVVAELSMASLVWKVSGKA